MSIKSISEKLNSLKLYLEDKDVKKIKDEPYGLSCFDLAEDDPESFASLCSSIETFTERNELGRELKMRNHKQQALASEQSFEEAKKLYLSTRSTISEVGVFTKALIAARELEKKPQQPAGQQVNGEAALTNTVYQRKGHQDTLSKLNALIEKLPTFIFSRDHIQLIDANQGLSEDEKKRRDNILADIIKKYGNERFFGLSSRNLLTLINEIQVLQEYIALMEQELSNTTSYRGTGLFSALFGSSIPKDFKSKVREHLTSIKADIESTLDDIARAAILRIETNQNNPDIPYYDSVLESLSNELGQIGYELEFDIAGVPQQSKCGLTDIEYTSLLTFLSTRAESIKDKNNAITKEIEQFIADKKSTYADDAICIYKTVAYPKFNTNDENVLMQLEPPTFLGSKWLGRFFHPHQYQRYKLTAATSDSIKTLTYCMKALDNAILAAGKKDKTKSQLSEYDNNTLIKLYETSEENLNEIQRKIESASCFGDKGKAFKTDYNKWLNERRTPLNKQRYKICNLISNQVKVTVGFESSEAATKGNKPLSKESWANYKNFVSQSEKTKVSQLFPTDIQLGQDYFNRLLELCSRDNMAPDAKIEEDKVLVAKYENVNTYLPEDSSIRAAVVTLHGIISNDEKSNDCKLVEYNESEFTRLKSEYINKIMPLFYSNSTAEGRYEDNVQQTKGKLIELCSTNYFNCNVKSGTLRGDFYSCFQTECANNIDSNASSAALTILYSVLKCFKKTPFTNASLEQGINECISHYKDQTPFIGVYKENFVATLKSEDLASIFSFLMDTVAKNPLNNNQLIKNIETQIIEPLSGKETAGFYEQLLKLIVSGDTTQTRQLLMAALKPKYLKFILENKGQMPGSELHNTLINAGLLLTKAQLAEIAELTKNEAIATNQQKLEALLNAVGAVSDESARTELLLNIKFTLIQYYSDAAHLNSMTNNSGLILGTFKVVEDKINKEINKELSTSSKQSVVINKEERDKRVEELLRLLNENNTSSHIIFIAQLLNNNYVNFALLKAVRNKLLTQALNSQPDSLSTKSLTINNNPSLETASAHNFDSLLSRIEKTLKDNYPNGAIDDPELLSANMSKCIDQPDKLTLFVKHVEDQALLKQLYFKCLKQHISDDENTFSNDAASFAASLRQLEDKLNPRPIAFTKEQLDQLEGILKDKADTLAEEINRSEQGLTILDNYNLIQLVNSFKTTKDRKSILSASGNYVQLFEFLPEQLQQSLVEIWEKHLAENLGVINLGEIDNPDSRLECIAKVRTGNGATKIKAEQENYISEAIRLQLSSKPDDFLAACQLVENIDSDKLRKALLNSRIRFYHISSNYTIDTNEAVVLSALFKKLPNHLTNNKDINDIINENKKNYYSNVSIKYIIENFGSKSQQREVKAYNNLSFSEEVKGFKAVLENEPGDFALEYAKAYKSNYYRLVDIVFQVDSSRTIHTQRSVYLDYFVNFIKGEIQNAAISLEPKVQTRLDNSINIASNLHCYLGSDEQAKKSIKSILNQHSAKLLYLLFKYYKENKKGKVFHVKLAKLIGCCEKYLGESETGFNINVWLGNSLFKIMRGQIGLSDQESKPLSTEDLANCCRNILTVAAELAAELAVDPKSPRVFSSFKQEDVEKGVEDQLKKSLSDADSTVSKEQLIDFARKASLTVGRQTIAYLKSNNHYIKKLNDLKKEYNELVEQLKNKKDAASKTEVLLKIEKMREQMRTSLTGYKPKKSANDVNLADALAYNRKAELHNREIAKYNKALCKDTVNALGFRKVSLKPRALIPLGTLVKDLHITIDDAQVQKTEEMIHKNKLMTAQLIELLRVYCDVFEPTAELENAIKKGWEQCYLKLQEIKDKRESSAEKGTYIGNLHSAYSSLIADYSSNKNTAAKQALAKNLKYFLKGKKESSLFGYILPNGNFDEDSVAQFAQYLQGFHINANEEGREELRDTLKDIFSSLIKKGDHTRIINCFQVFSSGSLFHVMPETMGLLIQYCASSLSNKGVSEAKNTKNELTYKEVIVYLLKYQILLDNCQLDSSSIKKLLANTAGNMFRQKNIGIDASINSVFDSLSAADFSKGDTAQSSYILLHILEKSKIDIAKKDTATKCIVAKLVALELDITDPTQAITLFKLLLRIMAIEESNLGHQTQSLLISDKVESLAKQIAEQLSSSMKEGNMTVEAASFLRKLKNPKLSGLYELVLMELKPSTDTKQSALFKQLVRQYMKSFGYDPLSDDEPTNFLSLPVKKILNQTYSKASQALTLNGTKYTNIDMKLDFYHYYEVILELQDLFQTLGSSDIITQCEQGLGVINTDFLKKLNPTSINLDELKQLILQMRHFIKSDEYKALKTDELAKAISVKEYFHSLEELFDLNVHAQLSMLAGNRDTKQEAPEQERTIVALKKEKDSNEIPAGDFSSRMRNFGDYDLSSSTTTISSNQEQSTTHDVKSNKVPGKLHNKQEAPVVVLEQENDLNDEIPLNYVDSETGTASEIDLTNIFKLAKQCPLEFRLFFNSILAYPISSDSHEMPESLKTIIKTLAYYLKAYEMTDDYADLLSFASRFNDDNFNSELQKLACEYFSHLCHQRKVEAMSEAVTFFNRLQPEESDGDDSCSSISAESSETTNEEGRALDKVLNRSHLQQAIMTALTYAPIVPSWQAVSRSQTPKKSPSPSPEARRSTSSTASINRTLSSASFTSNDLQTTTTSSAFEKSSSSSHSHATMGDNYSYLMQFSAVGYACLIQLFGESIDEADKDALSKKASDVSSIIMNKNKLDTESYKIIKQQFAAAEPDGAADNEKPFVSDLEKYWKMTTQLETFIAAAEQQMIEMHSTEKMSGTNGSGSNEMPFGSAKQYYQRYTDTDTDTDKSGNDCMYHTLLRVAREYANHPYRYVNIMADYILSEISRHINIKVADEEKCKHFLTFARDRGEKEVVRLMQDLQLLVAYSSLHQEFKEKCTVIVVHLQAVLNYVCGSDNASVEEEFNKIFNDGAITFDDFKARMEGCLSIADAILEELNNSAPDEARLDEARKAKIEVLILNVTNVAVPNSLALKQLDIAIGLTDSIQSKTLQAQMKSDIKQAISHLNKVYLGAVVGASSNTNFSESEINRVAYSAITHLNEFYCYQKTLRDYIPLDELIERQQQYEVKIKGLPKVMQAKLKPSEVSFMSIEPSKSVVINPAESPINVVGNKEETPTKPRNTRNTSPSFVYRFSEGLFSNIKKLGELLPDDSVSVRSPGEFKYERMR